MEDSKKWWTSKTVWGGLVAVGAGLAGLFGFNIAPDLQADITTEIVGVASAVGGVIAIIGRVVASKKVG